MSLSIQRTRDSLTATAREQNQPNAADITRIKALEKEIFKAEENMKDLLSSSGEIEKSITEL